VCEITDADFDQRVLRAHGPVIVNFTSGQDTFCREIEPAMRDMAAQYEGRADVYRLNIDCHRAIAERYNIQDLPELFIFKNGEAKWKFIGRNALRRLDAFLGGLLGGN
jgi:thioredoxin 1